MKRVAILKEHLERGGGLEHYTKKVVEAFQKKECDVTVLTRDYLGAGKLTAFDNACKKWVLDNPVDVVLGMERTTSQTHYRAGSGVHAVYLQRRKLTDPWFKKYLLRMDRHHQEILRLEKKCFENPLLKRLFTNSEMVKQEILAHYRIDPAKIEVIMNGAPYTCWEKAFVSSPQNKKTFELLFIGNGFRRKGLLFVIKSLKSLNIKDLHLSVVGSDKEEHFFKKEAYGLNVTFYGEQEDPLPFYQKADCLCIPSIYDPCANVTLEALAMGVFVISSRFNGAHEVLRPVSGIVIDSFEEELVEALKQALRSPKTAFSAKEIRETVKDLDFRIQLDKLVERTLNE